jgi:predicted O-methyltransferase YrrM
MILFRKIINKLHKNITGKLIAKRELLRLRKDNDIVLRLLANVLYEVVQNKCTNEEKKWIAKIETLRNSLKTSTTELSINDYGAGSPDLKLTADIMYQGRIIVKIIGEICQNTSKPYKWDLLLFKLIREFHPTVCLELGTALGISAAYQGAACELNNNGRIITIEGSESLVFEAKKNIEKLNLNRVNIVFGRFQDKLQGVLQENAPIDYVFIDGHHDESATLTYFKQILPYLSDGAILVFDDIYWSDGMKRAWNTIQKNKNLKISIDLFDVGICIFSKSVVEKQKNFKIII